MTDSRAVVQSTAKYSVYLGTFIHSKSLGEVEILHDNAIYVNEQGRIVAIAKGVDDDSVRSHLSRLEWPQGSVVVRACGKEQFFFPGFIDTHIHASQYPNAGIFGKSTLLDWLNKYTFPLESSLSSPEKAGKVYSRCIARTLSYGTTTAAYYATISAPSTNLLADLCFAAGQRAFIGRCCMDSSLSPEWYRDQSAESSVQDTIATINHIKGIDPSYTIVSPIVTPRFAPSCTSPLLSSLGTLAKDYGLPIQTHISENHDEIKLVKKLFPEYENYADVYDKHGLLGPRTVLAHAIHLSDAERTLISQRRAKVSHCAASNSSLASGTARVRWLLDGGVDVGLGTDVSGGYSPSILEAVRQSLLVSRLVAVRPEEGEKAKLTVDEALYLATRGGAKVLGLEEKVGAFEVGMEWDAQGGAVDVFGWEVWEEKLAKWVFNGDDRNTLAVWVKGRLVHPPARI